MFPPLLQWRPGKVFGDAYGEASELWDMLHGGDEESPSFALTVPGGGSVVACLRLTSPVAMTSWHLRWEFSSDDVSFAAAPAGDRLIDHTVEYHVLASPVPRLVNGAPPTHARLASLLVGTSLTVNAFGAQL